MNLRYTNRSKDDLDIAVTWYEKQQRGLGFEFLDCEALPHESLFLVCGLFILISYWLF